MGRTKCALKKRARGDNGGTLVGLLVFLVLVCAIAAGVKFFADRRARILQKGIEAQICAEEVVAAYLLPVAEREELFKEKGIEPRPVGEEARRAALAQTRMAEDVRPTEGPLAFAPYENFRSKYLGRGIYRVESHVILRDAADNREWIVSYECLASCVGDTEMWDVANIRFEGVPIYGAWNVRCSNLKLEFVGGTWSVRDGELALGISDNSRPVRQVQLGSGSAS